MRFWRYLYLTVLCVVLVASSAVFACAYSLKRSVGPSMFMAVVDAAGGFDKVLSQILDYSIPRYSPDPNVQAALRRSWRAAVTPAVVEDWVKDAASGVKGFLYSGGREASMLIDLRPFKSAFLEEYRKSLPSGFDEMEKQLEAIPDRPSLARWIDLGPLRSSSSSRYYRLAADAPISAGVIALACGLLIGFGAGRKGGLRLAGACLFVGGLVALAAVSYAAGGPVRAALADMPGSLNGVLAGIVPGLASEIPVAANPKTLAQTAVDFAVSQARVTSGALLVAGAVLAFFPTRRKASQTTSPQR